MKRKYDGLTAIKIPIANTNSIMMTSSQCFPVYTTHFDTNNNLICDSQEYIPGASDVSTQLWGDCEIGAEED